MDDMEEKRETESEIGGQILEKQSKLEEMWRREKWENKCVGESKSRKNINKFGGNICGDRILYRAEEK